MGCRSGDRHRAGVFALTSLPLYPFYKKPEVKASPHAVLRAAHGPASLQHEGLKRVGTSHNSNCPMSPKMQHNLTVPQFPQIHPKEHQHITVPAWIPHVPAWSPQREQCWPRQREAGSSRIQPRFH